MPDRVLRANILTSDAVNLLGWPAEVFYRRLMSIVDDFGRYDARPEILRGALYPLKLDNVSKSDVVKWMNECSDAGLVRLYSTDGREYLEVLKFGQRLRAAKSKFPAPCGQMSADVRKQPPIRKRKSETETDLETEAETDKNFRAPPDLSNSNLYRQPKIPTKEDVLREFLSLGGTQEMADSFYERNEGTGWFYKGSPITNFKNFVYSFVENWKKNDLKEKKSNNGSNTSNGNIGKKSGGFSILAEALNEGRQ